MNKIIPAILSTALLITGCEKKFLEVEQPGVVSVGSTEDYDMLLNSDNINAYFGWPLFALSDNIEFDANRTPSGATGMLYTWQDQPYEDTDPLMWSTLYSTIFHANLVINGVEAASGGSVQEKARLKAEGLLARTYAIFCALQLYAKPYDQATAATDPGIPYITTSDMYANNPGRSTVKACYEKMITDLEAALPHLPNTNNATYRGSKAAAYGLLTRICLHMKDYNKVISNADAALALKSTVTDYTAPDFIDPVPVNNPEFLFLRVNTEISFYTAFLTADAEALLPATDARSWLYGSVPSDSQFGITVPETMLSKAEALARRASPDLTAALTIINNLNKKRDEAHVDLNSADVTEVLNWVLDERRRELMGSPLRWFDMRRLTAEGRTPTVIRKVGADTYTLTPDSKKYTLQIPQAVLNFNPDMQLNPR